MSGTIQPGRYYLVQEFHGAADSQNLPAADATGGINMSATTGKVALVNNATPLAGVCPSGPNIVDMVGYGTSANCSEAFPTSNLNNTTAARRLSGGCVDTDNNSANFITGTPTPRNSASPINNCGTEPEPAVIPIHDVQGAGLTSPREHEMVTTEGIVTAIRNNGFFIQMPDSQIDSNPSTSEAIFVFTSSAPSDAIVARGNSVRVTGTVAEFRPASDPKQPPTTEISVGPVVALKSTGNALPVPVVISAADTRPEGTIDQLEGLEGMRVRVPSLVVVAPTGGDVSETNATASSDGVFFGVVSGISRPFRQPGISIFDTLPDGAPAGIARFDSNPELIRVQSAGQIGASVYDVPVNTIITDFVGVLNFAFRAATILPDPESLPVTTSVPEAVPVPEPLPDEFTVASVNLQRFFDTVNDPSVGDPVLTEQAFNDRLIKLSLAVLNVLRLPDVIGVQEAENLTTLQAIAARINADAATATGTNPNYEAFLEEGNDRSGIDVGFLVKTSRVAVVEIRQEGKSATFVDPTDGSPDILNDRPPLLLRAAIEVAGQPPVAFTVIVNHLRSLIGINDAEDGLRVRAKRKAQAEFLADLIQSRQSADPSDRIISVGDYNAFEFNDGYVDVIGTIRGTPALPDQVVTASLDLVNPDLMDLVDTQPLPERYSFIFDGSSQLLDHVLVTRNTLAMARRLVYARNNADFDETMRNRMGPERFSDHDIPVAYFSFSSTGPFLTNLTVSGKKLFVDGGNFAPGATILINGNPQKTKFQSSVRLIGKKAGRLIESGDIVQVQDSTGAISAGLAYSP